MTHSASTPTASPTFCDLVFNLLIAIHGLESSSTPNKWMRRTSFVLWLTALMFFPLSGPLYVYREILSKIEPRLSLSQITSTLSGFTFSAFTSYSAFVLRWKHAEIESLLRKNGRGMSSVISFLVLLVPEMLLDYLLAPHDGGLVVCISSYTFFLQHLAMATTLMIYNDLTGDLLEKLDEFRIAMSDPARGERTLIRERWMIRDRIRAVNSVCALPLSLFYPQLFLSTVYISGGLILLDLGFRVISLQTASFICFTSQILFLAYKASKVEAQSEEIEREYLQRVSNDASFEFIDTAVVRTFQLHKDWDCLQIACFPHNLALFWRYISVMLTCVAVVLQFDFKVVREITELSKRIPHATNY